MGAFGVELPENFDETNVEDAGLAPDSSKDTEAVESSEAPIDEAPLTPEEIISLENLPKFKFQGQEMTLKDLQNAVLMRKDYTQKTQETAEARKYAENFDVDLEKVISNPDLLKTFKEIYPASYSEKAEKILKMLWPKDNSQSPQQGPSKQGYELPKNVLERLDKIDRLEKWQLGQQQQIDNAKSEVIEKQLDDWFEDLGGKYKYADPDAVLTRAQAIVDAGHTLNKPTLERLFREKDESNRKAWSSSQLKQQHEQIKVADKVREAGKGGSTPSSAPVEHKSLKEVRKSLLSQFE